MDGDVGMWVVGTIRTIELHTVTSKFEGVPTRSNVWMSHGDRVTALGTGFETIATSVNCPFAAVRSADHKIYGLQFHPEVVHTEHGTEIYRTFVFDVCGCRRDWDPRARVEQVVADIKRVAGNRSVFFLISGGVDSTVAFSLCARALGSARVRATWASDKSPAANVSVRASTFERPGGQFAWDVPRGVTNEAGELFFERLPIGETYFDCDRGTSMKADIRAGETAADIGQALGQAPAVDTLIVATAGKAAEVLKPGAQLPAWWQTWSARPPQKMLAAWEKLGEEGQRELAGPHFDDMQTIMDTIAEGAEKWSAATPVIGATTGGAAHYLGHPYAAASLAFGPTGRAMVTQGTPFVLSGALRTPGLVPPLLWLPKAGRLVAEPLMLGARTTSQTVGAENWPEAETTFPPR